MSKQQLTESGVERRKAAATNRKNEMLPQGLYLRVSHIALIFTLLAHVYEIFGIDRNRQEVKKAHEMIFHAIFIPF
jgi:hypothetical protein